MMRRAFVLLSLLTCLLSAACLAANTRPLRSVLAPRDVIHNYETLTPIILYQSAETTHGNPHELWIKLGAAGEDFELRLTMNRNLLPQGYAETHFDQDGEMVVSKDRKNCFYHGTVEGHPDWSASISTCAGLRGMFGYHGDIESLYHIEPLEKDSDPTSIEQASMVYTASELSLERRNGTCGCKDHVLKPARNTIHNNLSLPKDRLKRQAAVRILEWVIVNDRRQFIAQGSSVMQTSLRSIEIANFVDLLYAKIGVRVALVGVQTWSNGDLIVVVSEAETLLNNFRAYRPSLLAMYPDHDSAMLITDLDLAGSTIGIAPVGAMCTSGSAGLSQDTSTTVAFVGSTAAHELGHIFSMNHDDGRGCTCTGTSNRCVMSAVSSNPPPVEWSSCSVSDLNAGYAMGLDSCLFNEPNMIFGDPMCGNGIREGDEVCDCGTAAFCDDPCCNAATCQLTAGAVCSNRESCCNNCQYRASGTVCRAVANVCDILERCTGSAGECPADRTLQDGTLCASGQAYCYDGMCTDLSIPCAASFEPSGGTPTGGPQECFDLNTRGTRTGNCGHSTTSFTACTSGNVRCGQLQCVNAGNFMGSFPTSILIQSQGVFSGGRVVTCSSFGTQPGSDIDPGLVPDGTRCGTNQICINRQCTALTLIACPSANSQMCSGNGQCNDLDRCSCNDGFTGSNCNTLVSGVPVNGGWTSWTSWSGCSASCEGGSRQRTRTCTQPLPQNGGANCPGSTSGTESCNIIACPVDGQWSTWGSWTTCSASCDLGQRARERQCDSPPPSAGGDTCPGGSSSNGPCNLETCPTLPPATLPTSWTGWGSWAPCSVSCNEGTRTRQRGCEEIDTSQPVSPDSCSPGDATEMEPCIGALNCTGDTASQGGSGGGSTGAVIGGVVAAILIAIAVAVVAIVVVVVILRRRRKSAVFQSVPTSSNPYTSTHPSKSTNGNVLIQNDLYDGPTSRQPPRPAPPSYNPPPHNPSYPPPPDDSRRRAPPPATPTAYASKQQAPPPPRPQAPYKPPPKPETALKPQAPSKPQAPLKPQAPFVPEAAPKTKPRVQPREPPAASSNTREPPKVLPKKPMKPPTKN